MTHTMEFMILMIPPEVQLRDIERWKETQRRFATDEKIRRIKKDCISKSEIQKYCATFERNPPTKPLKIWIAILVYILVAIAKKQLKNRGEPLHNSTGSQFFSFFEMISIYQALGLSDYKELEVATSNQLNLFE